MPHIDPLPDVSSILRDYEIMQDVLAASGHEWRNHLARLHLSLQMLCHDAECPLTPGQLETLDVMRATLLMMHNLSDAYLVTAALQGKEFVHPAWHSLESAIVRPVLFRHQAPLAISGQRVQLRINPPDLLVWAD